MGVSSIDMVNSTPSETKASITYTNNDDEVGDLFKSKVLEDEVENDIIDI